MGYDSPRALAVDQSKRTIRRYYTDDEIDEQRKILEKAVVRLERLSRRMARIRELMKKLTDPHAKARDEAVQALDVGYRDIEMHVYHVPNYETGEMEFVTNDGEVVDSRRLLPEERVVMPLTFKQEKSA